jgi:hypothetical protein
MHVKLLISTVILMLGGFAGFIYLKYFSPDYYFNLYPLIPVFFLLMLTGSYIALSIVRKRKSIVDMKIYMVIKMIKFFLCMLMVLLYGRIFNASNVSFVIVFASFYLVYLMLETWMFMKNNA